MEKKINLVGSSWETWLTFQEKGEPWARRTCKISAVYPEAKSRRVTCLQMCATALRSTPLATGDHECPFCDFVSDRSLFLCLFSIDPCVNLLPPRSPAGQVSYQRCIFSQSWRLDA